MKRRFSLRKKTAIWVTAAVLCLLAVIGTALFASAQGEEEILTTSYSYTGLSRYFKRADLIVNSAAGGYSAEDAGNKQLSMYFEFVFDDSELWKMSEEIIAANPDFPKQKNLSNEEWLTLVRRWLADNPEVCEPIGFSTAVRDNNGLIMFADESGIIRSDFGEEIGAFSISDGVLNVSLDPVVYFMEDIDFVLELQAYVSVREGSEESYEIIVNDNGRVESEKYGEWENKQKELPVPAYTISKTGPEKTDSPFITYTIDVRAGEGESLAGRKLVELIPKGMTLAAAEVSIDGGTAQDVLAKMANGVYTFDENAGAVSAVFTVTLSLSEEKLQQYYSGGINETFRNTAQLMGDDPAEPLAKSNTVSSTMKSSFAEKKGRALNSEETRYEWSVDIRTSLPNMACGYLIDRLSWDDHMYDFDKGITVKTEDGTYYITKDNILPSPLTPEWGAFDADAMYAGGSGLDTNFFDPPKAYYYFVETDKENIFASVDGNEHKRDCYLVIPYYGLQGGAYETKKVTVVYETERNMHGLSSADYWSFVENYINNGGTDFSRQQSNDVTFTWDGRSGEGPVGGFVPDSVEYGKEVESDPAVLIKRGEYYNASAMTASWSIDVDKLGFEADNAVVTDVLDPTVYDLSTLRVTMTVNDLATQTSGEATELAVLPAEETPEETPEAPAAPECTLKPDGTLTIDLGDIPEGCSYSFGIEAKVISPELLSTQSLDQTVENVASIEYVLNGVPHEYSTDAGLNVPNTLLAKQAVGDYNCDERTHTWKLIVGKNGLDIRDGVITDYLPEGFEYVPGSVIVSPAGLNVTDTLSADGRQVNFDLGESVDRQYTITYKTRATQAWIDANLIYSGEEGEKAEEKLISVVNNAVLNGTVNGSAIKDANGEIGAKASAANTAPVSPIEKYGVYSAAEGAIDWVVELNRVHYSIGNRHLVEFLSEELELVPGSVRVAASDGSDVSFEVTDESDTGFIVNFGEYDAAGEANTNRYRIEFRTLLTAAAENRLVANRVELCDADGSRVSESGYSDGGYKGGYTPENDSRAHLRPNLHVHKISGNSVNTVWGKYSSEDSLSLAGAEFTLEACEFTAENGVITLGDVEYTKKGYTDSDGDVYFGNLRTSADNGGQLLFRLWESKAPTGYVADGTAKFVYFRRENNENDKLSGDVFEIKESGGDVIASGERIKEPLLFIKDTEGEAGGWKRLECDFINSPDVNTLVICKEKLDWQTFGIDPKFIPVTAGVKFVVRQKGVLQLREQTFVTNEEGIAFIADLDPGRYTVTEADQPYGMEPISFELEVRCLDQEKQEWEYRINGTVVRPDEDGVFRYLIQNGASLTSLKINKKIWYSSGITESFSTINTQLRLVSVAPESRGGVPDGRIDRIVTTVSGAAEFKDLPIGNYKLYEINKEAPGYMVSNYDGETHLYDIAITQDPDGSLKKTLTKAQSGNDIVRYGSDNTVYNIPVTGTVTFDKSSYSEIITALNDQPIAGAEFGLFHKIGNSYYNPAAYTAKSDNDGKITFTGVKYGDYYLREVTAPEGFDAIAGNIRTLKRSDFTLEKKGSGYTFDYAAPAADVIRNTLHTEKLAFTKKDTDGNLLPGVVFDVYRRGTSAVGENGAGFVTVPAASCDTYYSYAPLAEVTTDDNGAVPGFTLPYGDYLFVERTSGGYDKYFLQEAHSCEALLVSVRNGSTTVDRFSSGTPLPYANGCYTVDTSAEGWGNAEKNAKDTSTGVNSFEVVNKRKYAFIQLKKTAADLLADGTTVDYQSYPLKDKTFVIKKDGTTCFTVKTLADGTLAIPADGAYSGRHLWYGDYTIEETGAPSGYSHPMPKTAFSINDATTGDGGTMLFSYNGDKVWLSWDNGETWHTADGAEASADEAPDGYFVNYLERSTFSVKKLGADGKALAGAEFELWTGKVKVADFTDNGNGTYSLKSTGENDPHGVPYIIDGSKLLKGYNYTLKETKAPQGYLLSDPCIVKVSKDNVITKTTTSTAVGSYSLKSNVLTVTDKLIERDVMLGKVFTGTESPVANVVFELFAAGEDKPLAEMTTDKDGKLTFAKLTEGDYILRENLEKSIEAGAADYVHIGDREYQIKVFAQQPDQKSSVLTINGETIAEGSVFTVENDRMNASVELTKIDGTDMAILPGVEFRLEKRTGNGYAPVSRNNNGGAFITDGSGKITVTELERGSYRLTETETLDGYNPDPALVITFDITNDDHGSVKTVRAGGTWFSIVSGGELLCAEGVKNVRIPGTLTLTKTDGVDGAPLNGVGFVLVRGEEEFRLLSGWKYSSPDDAKPKKTGDGVLEVGGLEWGSYVLRETSPLRGYCFGGAHEWNYDIGRNNGKAYLGWNIGGVKNDRNEIKITKTDALTGVVLADAEYTVTNTADASDSFIMKTDESGNAVLTGRLMAGQTYRLTESKAPYGYEKSSGSVTFTMGADGKIYIDSKASADNTFSLEDQPVRDTVIFEKRISFAGLPAVDGAPLKGAEFELRRALNGRELEEGDRGYAERIAVSDENGRVVFNDVPFGDYVLYEKSAPSGFVRPDGSAPAAEIKAAELAVTEEGFTADCSDEPITNELISGKLELYKREKREGLMSGVSFGVFRRGSNVVDTDGAGFTAAPESSVSSYYRFLPCPELTTDGSGIITAKLPYGDYLLVEDTEKFSLVDEACYVALLVQVRQSGVTARIRYAGTTLTPIRDGFRVDMSEGWNYAEKDGSCFIVENEKKLALIDLKKVAGNVTDSGKTVSFDDSPISGVRFTVTRKGEKEPLFTVITGSDGHLIADKNGESYSGKYLRSGTYILAESGTDISCEFTVSADAPNLSTYWFSYDGKKTVCSINPSEGSRKTFINIVERSPITVKTEDGSDGEDVPEETVFELFSKNDPDKPVATVTVDENGECSITDGSAEDENGIPYCVDGKLLPDEYVLSVKETPEGYLTPTDKLVKIDANGGITPAKTTSPSDSDVTVTLDRIMHDIRLRKVYAGEKYAGSEANEKLPDAVAKTTFVQGLTFVLCNKDGVPLLDGDIPAPITAVTDEQGVAVFKNVEEGTYIIREDARRSLASGAPDDIYLDTAKQIKVTVRADEIRNSSELVQTLDDGTVVPVSGNIIVEDERIAAAVKLYKYDSETGAALAGVSFRLDRAPAGSSDYKPYRTALTGKDGVMLLENLPKGNYKLSEIGALAGYSGADLPAITFEIENTVYNEALEVRKGQSWFKTETGAAAITPAGVANTPLPKQSQQKDDYPDTRVIQSESPQKTDAPQESVLKTATYSSNDNKLPSVAEMLTMTASSAGSRLMNNSKQNNVPTATKQESSPQQNSQLTDSKQQNGGNLLTSSYQQNEKNNRQEVSLIVDGDTPNPNTGSQTEIRLCIELIGFSLSAALMIFPKLRRRFRNL